MTEEKTRKKWIPLTSENERDHRLPLNDRECLRYSVLTRQPNAKAFGRFFPEYCDRKGKLTDKGREACDQFFALEANRIYREDYKNTVEKALGGFLAEPTEEISDTRKDKALKSLFHQAMSLVEGGKVLDPDTLKAATDIFKKIGLLKDDEEHIEAPRRYLPVRCGECEYKKFIDEMVRLGKIKKTEQ